MLGISCRDSWGQCQDSVSRLVLHINPHDPTIATPQPASGVGRPQNCDNDPQTWKHLAIGRASKTVVCRVCLAAFLVCKIVSLRDRPRISITTLHNCSKCWALSDDFLETTVTRNPPLRIIASALDPQSDHPENLLVARATKSVCGYAYVHPKPLHPSTFEHESPKPQPPLNDFTPYSKQSDSQNGRRHPQKPTSRTLALRASPPKPTKPEPPNLNSIDP